MRWLFSSQRSRFAIHCADISLGLALVAGLGLIWWTDVFLLCLVGGALAAQHYCKAIAINPAWLLSANAEGIDIELQEPIKLRRPALVTPIVIWVRVEKSNREQVWIAVWQDQCDPANWCRLRRVAHDLNH